MRLFYLSCCLMLVEVEVTYAWGFNAKVANSWKLVEGKKKWVPGNQIRFEEEVHAVSTDFRPRLVAMEKGSVVHIPMRH